MTRPAKRKAPRKMTMTTGTAPDGTPCAMLPVPEDCTHLVVHAIRGSISGDAQWAKFEPLAAPIVLKRGDVLTVYVRTASPLPSRPEKRRGRR